MTRFFETGYGWVLKPGLVEFGQAWSWQRGLVQMRRQGLARDTIILLEHPPVITVGRDGHGENFADCDLEPILIERGGDVTFHGPGQLVGYFVFNLTRRGRDLHRFTADLQQGIIDTLGEYGIGGRTDDDHTGVWVDDKKIASIGVAVKRWVSFHGVAINLNTDLKQFERIKPCGLEASRMTTAAELLGQEVNLAEFGDKLLEQYSRIFVTQFEPVALESLAEDLESQAGGYTI
jgi:lipoate-protein ligase B